MKFFGNVYWRRTHFPEDKKGPSEVGAAPGGVLDEDRVSESLTPENDEPVLYKGRVVTDAWIANLLMADNPMGPEIPRQQAEEMQRRQDRARAEPVALANIGSHERSFDLFAAGLRETYTECLLAGKLYVWAETARAIIDLLSSPYTKVHRRREFSDYTSNRVFDGTRPLSESRVEALKLNSYRTMQ